MLGVTGKTKRLYVFTCTLLGNVLRVQLFYHVAVSKKIIKNPNLE